MPEYRYLGVNVSGKPIQGVIFGQDNKTVKTRIEEISQTKGIRIDAVQKKTTFIYKVQKGLDKPMTGEQKAFTKEELRNALTKMGYRVHYVRKKWLDLSLKVPTNDLVLFVRICADLLREKFPYNEILTMVANDTDNKKLKETIRDIQRDLRAGQDGHAVYGKHADVLGRFTTHMLAVASTSGNMHAIYESTAKFLEREADFKRNIRSLLLMPLITVLAMVGSIVFYVLYIFPKISTMLTKYKIDIPPMTKATMDFSNFLQNHYVLIFAVILVPLIFFIQWARTEKGRYAIDRNLLRIPVLGPVLHKSSVEIFARVFYALYSTSGENIHAIRIAAESCRNRFIERQITTLVIPRMLKEGRSFVECLSSTNCFPVNAIRRLRSGEESGTLRESALQLANYYETESSHKLRRLMDLLNLLISILITLMIVGLTLVSSEIGFVSPPSPLMK